MSELQRARIKALAFGVGIPFLILSVFTGLVIPLALSVGPKYVTPWGLLLVATFFLQQLFAWLNNDRWTKRNRLYIRDLAASFVEEADKRLRVENFRRFSLDYDQWRKGLWEIAPELESYWTTIQTTMKGGKPRPLVGADVPVYGLDFEKEVKPTIESILKQSSPVDLIVIAFNEPFFPDNPKRADERATRLAEIDAYLVSLNDPRLKLLDLPAGKRGAMAAAWRLITETLGTRVQQADGSWILDVSNVRLLNVDGDTILDVDAVAAGLRAMDVDDRVRAITSNVRVLNFDINFLTESTKIRYRFANDIERGAQSLFYGVTCMSGPYMLLYAEDVLDVLKYPEEWEEQIFLETKVGPGDDRRMTQMLRKRGKGVIYHRDVITDTECPVEIPRWKKQQLRWTRSALRGFFSEFLKGWFYQKFHWWPILDEFRLAIFGFLLAGVIIRIVVSAVHASVTQGILSGWNYIWPYLAVVGAMNLLRTTAAMINSRDFGAWRSFFYLYYLLRYLLVMKLIAVFSLDDNNWLSRGEEETNLLSRIRRWLRRNS